MRTIVFAGLFLLAICEAGAADIYGEISRLRAGEGRCTSAARLPPLHPQVALEQAARDLARGDTLEHSVAAAGYRPTRASFFSFSGEGVGKRAAELLADRGDCRQLMDPAMTDVGVYVGSGELRIVLAAPFVPAVGGSEQAAGQRVLELINRARAAPRVCGDRKYHAAWPLRWNRQLAAASLAHAEDMARGNYFSHTGRDGSNPAQRAERAGYRYRSIGENIAGGQLKPEDAVAGWLKSPPHCANLMNGAFSEMGVAYAVNSKSEMGVYWAQEFGAPR